MSQGAETQLGFPSRSLLRPRFSKPCVHPARVSEEKLPRGEQGMRHQKGGNPGKPAESLENPLFDPFIAFFSPISAL